MLRRLLLLTMAALVALPVFVNVDAVLAGGRPHKAIVRAGTDRQGNDFESLEFKGGKRFKHKASNHFSMEEYLYGPGDQSRLWQRDFPLRDNDRSLRARAQARAMYDDGGGYGYGSYGGYSNSCDTGLDYVEDERIFESRRSRRAY